MDDYVFGCALPALEGGQFGCESDAKSRFDAMVAYLTERLGTGAYPHLEAVAGDAPAAGFARIGHLSVDEQRFERGLQRLLDGLSCGSTGTATPNPAALRARNGASRIRGAPPASC